MCRDIMRNAGLDEAQAGIKIAGRNINNLRYADASSSSKLEWKIGLPWANTRGSLNSPS